MPGSYDGGGQRVVSGMQTLAEQFDAFLFDLDGVVYVGDQPLPGSAEALGRLRAMGKAVRFLTNDPRFSRAELAGRLNRMGIEATPEEVVSCGWATAQHLRQEGVRSAYVVGSPSLARELQEAGIATDVAGIPQAVVVGADESLGYPHILRASRFILAGARFVATNADGSFPVPDGLAPATGAMVRSVEAATGQRPQIVGKPYPLMFRLALGTLAPNARAVVVGDNPATDILGAHQAGLPAILVARGTPPGSAAEDSAPSAAPTARDFRTPDAVIGTLLDLFRTGVPLRRWVPPPYPWPERVSPGVAAVVVDAERRVLWVRRRDNGLWSLPSGRVEPGETVQEAIRREVMEEAGLAVRVVRLTGVYSEPTAQVFVYPSGEAVHFITCCFLCAVEGGRLRPPEVEVLEAAFFEPGERPPGVITIHLQWVADALAGQPEAFVR